MIKFNLFLKAVTHKYGANAISLAEKFLPILDELYKREALTAPMDGLAKPVEFAGANVVQVFKTSMVGLGTYSRSAGYPAGDVTGTWETLTLANERGRKFTLDRMDNEETLGMAFGTLAGEFMRTQVAPEVDAYRFAKYAGWTDVLAATPGTLDATTILPALDAAALAMDEAEVPGEGRLLYISATCNSYLKEALTRFWANETGIERRPKSLDGMTIIPVPQARFYTKIDLNAGATSNVGGFIKNVASGKDLNFMLVHPSAVLQVKKHDNLKIFDPDINQSSDGWLIEYRLYHDAFVYDNKVNGVYIHNKA